MTAVTVLVAWALVAASASMALRSGARAEVARRAVGDLGVRPVRSRDRGRGGDPAPRRPSTLLAGLRRHRVTRQDLIVLVDELTASLGSGASPVQALSAASRLPGPMAEGLCRATRQIGHGRGAQEVIDEWAAAHPEVGAPLVADALALADATGGSRTRALGGVRATLREAEGLASEVRALAAQTRLSATVLTVLPVGFAALVAAADSRIASFLFGTTAGWFCLAGGAVLDAVGALWMSKLTGGLR